MTQSSALEQYMLELVNAERAKAGAQPLAADSTLNAAADSHSQWMIDTDTFSHAGAGGSTATERMSDAGFDFSGSWASAENIAWVSTRNPAGLQDEVDLLHSNLMNSPGHKANILNPDLREIGIGVTTGSYQKSEGAFVTQDFAKTSTGQFLTGVAFDDQNGDGTYDPGEGLGGLTVTATDAAGTVFSTTTGEAGGYDLALPQGNYSVTFSGSGLAQSTLQVAIGANNMKLDWIDPTAIEAQPPVILQSAPDATETDAAPTATAPTNSTTAAETDPPFESAAADSPVTGPVADTAGPVLDAPEPTGTPDAPGEVITTSTAEPEQPANAAGMPLTDTRIETATVTDPVDVDPSAPEADQGWSRAEDHGSSNRCTAWWKTLDGFDFKPGFSGAKAQAEGGTELQWDPQKLQISLGELKDDISAHVEAVDHGANEAESPFLAHLHAKLASAHDLLG